MKKILLTGLIAAALGSGCERMKPANLPANKPRVVQNAPRSNVPAGPVYQPSLDEQLTQKLKIPSAEVAAYVLNNAFGSSKWSEMSELQKSLAGDSAELVEGDAVFFTAPQYFQHRVMPNHKSTVFVTPRVIETGGKHMLALETITIQDGKETHILRVDEGPDGTVDKGYDFTIPEGGSRKPYVRRKNDIDTFVFGMNLRMYKENVIDRKRD